MSKRSKSITMTLGQFHQHIEEQAQASSRRTRDGKISDRLRARKGDRERPVGNRQNRRPLSTAARIVSKERTSNVKLDINEFPMLGECEAPNVAVSGAWSQGIQPILDAVDLPDPQVIARQAALDAKRAQVRERDNARSRTRTRTFWDKTRRRYESSESESGSETDMSELELDHESDSEPPVHDPLAPMAAGDYSDDDWEDVL